MESFQQAYDSVLKLLFERFTRLRTQNWKKIIRNRTQISVDDLFESLLIIEISHQFL